jgi:hypothetical protein
MACSNAFSGVSIEVPEDHVTSLQGMKNKSDFDCALKE